MDNPPLSAAHSGTLYLVATPIGNLGDLSARAVKTLSAADFIAAEDTRVSRKLLEYLKIKKQLVSYYEHNRRESGEMIAARLMAGESCALITDAGTPAISDPGEDIVRLCAEEGIPVVSIPGPCAAIAALSKSGLPTGRFVFEGFLSTAKKNRFERLNELKAEQRTIIFYEAPHKLIRTLDDLLAILGDRRLSISREITKLHEETLRCTLSEAAAHFKTTAPRGEFTLVVEGAAPAVPDTGAELDAAASTALEYIDGGMSAKDAARRAAGETGQPKNAIYKRLVDEINSE